LGRIRGVETKQYSLKYERVSTTKKPAQRRKQRPRDFCHWLLRPGANYDTRIQIGSEVDMGNGRVAPVSRPRDSLSRGVAAILALSFVLATGAIASGDTYAGEFVTMNGFDRASMNITNRDSHIDFTIDPLQEHFSVYVPTKYTDDQPYGLLVFVNSDDQLAKLPPGWVDLLEKRKLIFACPLNAGDSAAASRRLCMAAYAAGGAESHWNIDRKRVYVAGFGGGAQIAEHLGFFAPDIFRGSIAIGGADFYKPLPTAESGQGSNNQAGIAAGLTDATQSEIDAAKQNVRFAFVTGEKDSLRNQVRAIAADGFAKEGFQSTAIDVPYYGHEICPPRQLSQAIDFIESVKTIPTTEPTPPAWMAKDPNDWPQILLRNKLVSSDGGVGYAGSSSLFRLPGGVVVLGTAGHVLGDTKIADFSSAFKSWTAYAVDPDGPGVLTPRVAMDVANPPKIDVLVLCPRSQYEDWPSTVLPIRQHPLEIGDKVYLIAVPFNGTTRQNVYPAVIVDREPYGEWDYNVDGTFDHEGMSGAPVMDEYGQLAAINVGHLLDQKIPGKLQLLCIDATDVLRAIKLPADVKPPRGSSESAQLNSSAADLNQEADTALRGAQVFIDNQMYGPAKAKLQTIIKAFPSTSAAKKAQELLSQLPGQ
jgi:predicted esterase